MSETPRTDAAPAPGVPDPAVANTAADQEQLGPEIAKLTREFSTDILDARGSKVSEDQDPALISYERETQVGGGRVREITEFLVPHDSATNGVTIKYLSIYKHPNGGNTIIETLEGLSARVDVSAENGRVLDIERNEVSDVASRIAPQGFQPRPDLPEETQLHAKLSDLQQNPGLVTLRLGYTTSRL
jgi:hypothetical protein